MEIIIIGTNPPCPRCDLVSLRVEETVEENALGSLVEITHLAYSEAEAIKIGEKLGRKLGTAKHVAAEGGLEFDKEAFNCWTEERINAVEVINRPADIWNQALDDLLAKYQAMAESVSYLMTPILIVNGEVKHHGSVPARDRILQWIKESL